MNKIEKERREGEWEKRQTHSLTHMHIFNIYAYTDIVKCWTNCSRWWVNDLKNKSFAFTVCHSKRGWCSVKYKKHQALFIHGNVEHSARQQQTKAHP